MGSDNSYKIALAGIVGGIVGILISQNMPSNAFALNWAEDQEKPFSHECPFEDELRAENSYRKSERFNDRENHLRAMRDHHEDLSEKEQLERREFFRNEDYDGMHHMMRGGFGR